MGVTGLWTVLQPCARPIKLETLNKKRLAVDASIWIYQFLKAVRDKEGNALRNSHVVGFFRRICKLLFFGIKPVFVFDGGAPALKRQTINARKSRREGRRDDATRTAGKLLAVQMHRIAEENERKRREEAERPRRPAQEEEALPENLVYVEELNMTERERRQNRTFRKKDAYHLPELDVSLSEMGAPNDPRIMSQEELEEYARQFHTGEDINFYDFSKIDFNSSFFQSLPASDRYNILNAARLRSRLRMGYSKEQLETMFPDRMEFSRFQIERVAERNDLTQRLMNLNGMNGEDFSGPGRIAGEKGKEYVLVKNDGVEGGWALGVVSNKHEGEREQPIDVERLDIKPKDEDDEDWEEQDGFIDVPIEGLNRLPKPTQKSTGIEALQSDETVAARRALYQSRRDDARVQPAANESEDDDPDALFLPPEPKDNEDEDEGMDELFEDVLSVENNEEDEELQRAIAMSLEKPEGDDAQPASSKDGANRAVMLNGPRIDKPLDFDQKNAKSGRAFAEVTNNRAHGHVADQNTFVMSQPSPPKPAPPPAKKRLFGGPLPFESLDLGKSFLRPKKKAEQEGGFEKEDEKKAEPLPPWFAGGDDVREGNAAQKAMEDREDKTSESRKDFEFQTNEPILRRNHTKEVIDVDDEPDKDSQNVIEVESSDEGSDVVMEDVRPVEKPQVVATPDRPTSAAQITPLAEGEKPPDSIENPSEGPAAEGTMDDVADLIRAEPPTSTTIDQITEPDIQQQSAEDSEEFEWSESEHGDKDEAKNVSAVEPAGGEIRPSSAQSSSPEPDFEDVEIPEAPAPQHEPSHPKDFTVPSLPQEDTLDQIPADAEMIEDDFSDPEDEDLMRQLAEEAEEHARFASAISATTQLQSVEDYERELKQLRNQQKKDRRDADEVTQVMITECQQLLQLFGLPYITAPMEAEAQCAELVSLGLVDGIVTDDSDTFLFGGTRVYKNMFNQAKYVECYLSSDLEKEYSLTREKIIQIAHLLGSDYTEGLPNVGPVTALEILSEFPSLNDFKDWWAGVQNGTINVNADKKSAFRRKFRKNATKLFLPPVFPDTRVDEAYLYPEVDKDPSIFQWGVPDLDRLRAFLMATIGWSQERADEILVPVIKDMNKREQEGTQANITQFFGGAVGTGTVRQREVGVAGGHGTNDVSTPGERFAPRRRGLGKSKRMENALGRLHDRAQAKDDDEGEEVEEPAERSKAKKQRNTKQKKRAKPSESEDSEDSASGDDYAPPKKATKRGKKVMR